MDCRLCQYWTRRIRHATKESWDEVSCLLVVQSLEVRTHILQRSHSMTGGTMSGPDHGGSCSASSTLKKHKCSGVPHSWSHIKWRRATKLKHLTVWVRISCYVMECWSIVSSDCQSGQVVPYLKSQHSSESLTDMQQNFRASDLSLKR